MPAYIDEIMSVAKKYDIPVLEDAAEAFGSTYKGQVCGTFGAYGALSFNGNKMITTSGGGALVCPDEESKKKVMFYATQAREPYPYYHHEKIGYNYRMSNICAGIGRGQMTVADEHIAHHRTLHQLYVDLFADNAAVAVHSVPERYMQSNYWLTTIRLNAVNVDSAAMGSCDVAPDAKVLNLQKELDSQGIETRPLWKPLHLHPVFKDAPSYTNGVSERLFRCGLCLPSGPCVSEEQAMMIVKAIKGHVC